MLVSFDFRLKAIIRFVCDDWNIHKYVKLSPRTVWFKQWFLYIRAILCAHKTPLWHTKRFYIPGGAYIYIYIVFICRAIRPITYCRHTICERFRRKSHGFRRTLAAYVRHVRRAFRRQLGKHSSHSALCAFKTKQKKNNPNKPQQIQNVRCALCICFASDGSTPRWRPVERQQKYAA